jgi:O-antigen ligase
LTPGAGPISAVNRNGAAGPVLFWVVAAMLVFAPLVRGGNRPLALLALEIAGLLVIAALAWSRQLAASCSALPATIRLALALLVLVPLAQLVPMPASWWAAMPGHAAYELVLEAAGAAGDWRPLSINPDATQYAGLALIPCVSAFLAVQALPRRQVRSLVMVFIAVALAQAVLGILQVGAGKDSALNLGNPFGGGSATGTYVNKNHFAALMAMALPMLVAVWAAETLPTRDAEGSPMREHPRHADAKLARRIAWSLAIGLAMAALLFTRSRAGIGCGLAAFAAASLGLVWSTASLRIRAALAAAALFAFALAAYVGLTPLLERFTPDVLSISYEGRVRAATATIHGALEFLPLGSGLGTFADVFRRYQSEGLTGFFDHAHNDYAEAFLELGVAGVAIVLLAAIAYLARWKIVAARRYSRTLGYLQVSAGLAIAAVAVHGAFDFNFHIPANALYFGFLAGVFFREPSH